MIVVHPPTRRVVELTEPVRRGGVLYPTGYQFTVLSITAEVVAARDESDGNRVVLPVGVVKAVVEPTPQRRRPTLAALKAAGLVKKGSDLRGGA